MPDIFLSYSREDLPTARRFADALEREGFSVWWDQSLNPGEAFDKVTERALEEARAVVVLWSKHSVDSRWVRAEATQANSRGTLVPVMIEPCKRPIMFELTHTANLADWKGDSADASWQSYVSGVRRIIGQVAPVAASMPSTSVATTSPRGSRISGRAIGIIVVAALFVGAGLWAISRKGVEPAAQPTASTAIPSAELVTLAVLPFADLSAAHDQEYFSDGLTEELLNQLAQIKGLRVTARTSSFSFKGKNEDVRVIGEKLGVANLLEGSVRKDGTHLRITAQLVNGKDGGHLWSKTYARELSDVFALQEEVAKDVAKALSIKLDIGDLPRIEGGTTSVEAYDEFLQARKLYSQGGSVLSRQAAQHLRKAVALDPQFSRAWWLQTYALSESLTGVKEAESALVIKERDAAAARVQELSPDAWWARAQRANQFMALYKWTEAEAAVDAGAAPSDHYEENGPRYAFLTNVGRYTELVQRLELARQLDPLSFIVSGDLQFSLDSAGQPDAAQLEYERSHDLEGIHQRAHVYALMRVLGRKDATPAAIGNQFQTLLDAELLYMPITHALAKTYERPEEAREVIRLAIADPANQDRVRMAVVTLYADAFGERELALVALQRSVGSMRNVASLWFPYKTDLRADPRFKALLREVELADYFRTSGTWNDFCRPVGTDDFECH